MAMKMLKRALRFAAILAGTSLCVSLVAWLIWRIRQPSPNSAEGLLVRADKLAWKNNWLTAFPLYVRAEHLFRIKGDRGYALYAHVSQIAVRMEGSDLSLLIAELNRDLVLPEAQAPGVRLRILEMKAKCEQEYDAGIAKKTFAEVEQLALKEHKLYLASRASGEQGILAFTLGNLDEATSRVRRAYAVAKYLGDPAAHVRYAEMIGLGIEQLDRPKQALKFLDEAISTQERHPDIARPSVAFGAKIDSLAELGQYNEALTLADQALDFPRKHRFYGQLQSLLTSRADVLVRTGRTTDAISEYLEALDYAKTIRSWRGITNIDAKLAGAYEHVGMLPKALSSIDEAIWANQQIPQEMFFVPGNLAIKARIQAKLGRRGEAEHLYLKGADMLDVMLKHVPTPEIERLLLTELGDLYSGFFELLSDEGRYADAFRVIEQAHGHIEAQELEYDHTEEPHGSTPDDDQLRALELDLLNTDDVRTRAEILHEIHTFQQINWVRRTDERTATLAEVQRQLAPHELLVEYVLAKPQSYALVIGRSSVARYGLPTKEAVEKEASRYADDLRKQRTNPQLGRQLFQELLGFTRDYPNATSLIIAADGSLHLMPFNALIDESGKYVLESKSVSATPSGTVLCLLRHRVQEPAATRPYLGVAAWTDAGDRRPWVLRAVSADSKPSEWPPLPESRDEVESIAAMMPMPPSPKVLIGQNATKEQFQRLPLGDYRVLHLALHGVADPVFPDRSAIVFAPSKRDDGRLEARDIRRMHLHAALVTLSACDTGVGPVGATGVESVDTAFIEAGASSVVSTLWKLEDHATNRLMKSFYANLGHEAKADALRHAELDLLHSGLTPFYWASYELVGDPKGALFKSNATD